MNKNVEIFKIYLSFNNLKRIFSKHFKNQSDDRNIFNEY